jgi:putative membrane protein
MPAQPVLSVADREALVRAVRGAEARTSGEIVVDVVESCGGYGHAVWKGTALGALAAGVVAAVVHDLGKFWGGAGWLWGALPTAAGAAAGYSLAFLPAIRRWLATPEALAGRVRDRAAAAFLEHEVFATRERTGILLFVALFEHRVVVLGDRGISARVSDAEWEAVVAPVVEGMRAGRPLPALLAAVERCGALLEQHGFARRADDLNELPDAPG